MLRMQFLNLWVEAAGRKGGRSSRANTELQKPHRTTGIIPWWEEYCWGERQRRQGLSKHPTSPNKNDGYCLSIYYLFS